MKLDIIEIETLRHSLRMLRQNYRDQLRICHEESSQKAERDAVRFNTLISRSLTLDEKLSEMQIALRANPNA